MLKLLFIFVLTFSNFFFSNNLGVNTELKQKNTISEEINKSALTKYIKNGQDASIYSVYDIYYLDETEGYFIQFEKNGKLLESLLVKINNSNYEIVAIYEPDLIPFENGENLCVSPYEFTNQELASVKASSDLESKVQFDDCNTFSINANQNSNHNYLPIENVNSNLYFYGASYLSETKIIDVPNYMNTQYNNMGCSPTTAAMYFSYLEDNGYSNFANNLNLPISHTDDINKVNSFIKYIGDNYFNTTINGTFRNDIVRGYNEYFRDKGKPTFECHRMNDYQEFCNSIRNYAMPVHISLVSPSHSVLGIGYREVQNNHQTTRYINTNYVYNDQMAEVAIAEDNVYCYYFMYEEA